MSGDEIILLFPTGLQLPPDPDPAAYLSLTVCSQYCPPHRLCALPAGRVRLLRSPAANRPATYMLPRTKSSLVSSHYHHAYRSCFITSNREASSPSPRVGLALQMPLFIIQRTLLRPSPASPLPGSTRKPGSSSLYRWNAACRKANVSLRLCLSTKPTWPPKISTRVTLSSIAYNTPFEKSVVIVVPPIYSSTN